MKNTFLLLAMFGISQVAFMQTLSRTALSSGSNAHESSDTQISWTLGEVMSETYSGSDNILSQGFNQPQYEVEMVNTNLTSTESISVYPVPASDYIQVNYVSPRSNELSAALFNTEGQKVLEQTYNKGNFKMNLESLSPAVYILKIFDQNSRLIQSTKIIKE